MASKAVARRSEGEGHLPMVSPVDRVLVALVAKYGRRLNEFGSRGHATGHVKRVGFEEPSFREPFDR